jgi:DNA-binding response OmpR family regulator
MLSNYPSQVADRRRSAGKPAGTRSADQARGPSPCIKALSADEALSLLLEHEFAMAILDVQMPGMNGFELAELMRGTEKTKNIPIVFVSAAGRELNYAFKGYESGAVDFLHKPLDIHAVKSKVNVFVDLFARARR